MEFILMEREGINFSIMCWFGIFSASLKAYKQRAELAHYVSFIIPLSWKTCSKQL